jgi:hypothetical protein
MFLKLPSLSVAIGKALGPSSRPCNNNNINVACIVPQHILAMVGGWLIVSWTLMLHVHVCLRHDVPGE